MNTSKEKILFFQDEILEWFSENGRNFPWRCPKRSCYELVISEILLQRTKAETIASFFMSFLNRFPSWKSLATSKIEEIEEILKPIGLWKQRAPRLHKLSQEMVDRQGKFPRTQKELESLPAIGQYVANAIQLFCQKKSKPLLDGTMARILERFFGPRDRADIRYDPYLQNIAQLVVTHRKKIQLNWGILDIGAAICKRKPNCGICPLKTKCIYYIQLP